MATKYTFKYTDGSKTEFDVQPYTANGIKVPSSPALLDRAAEANTTLKIYGRGLKDYGEGVFQDLIYMLENFANSTYPRFSIEGQMWYNNVGTTGSPPTGAELFIRNATAGDGSVINGVGNQWDAVILATGTSAMTGELTLAGTPTDPNHAVPLSYLNAHIADDTLHLEPDQNTFLDGLLLGGSPASLQADDINQLIGVTGNVQTQLDNKLSLSGGTMDAGLSPPANITFQGGEVLGLPAVPSDDTAAASKKYVDDSASAGTGELTDITWVTQGSPLYVADPTETTALFHVVGPSIDVFIPAEGISRHGHDHTALEISLDNSFNTLYPTNVQAGFEYVNQEIQGLGGGGTGPVEVTISIERKFEILTSDILAGSPVAPYEVLSHFADDNALSITINGVKQYTNTHAYQDILFDAISGQNPTYLDESLDYDFNISVNGGSPSTLITITAGTTLTTFGDLINAINSAMNDGTPPAVGNAISTISSNDGIIRFSTTSSGTGSEILVSDPLTANTYLFEVDSSPDTITGATFLSEPNQPASPPGSPPSTPDSIEILGDVTSSFPSGQIFSIKGSNDANYGSYDGIYSVHVSGAVAAGSPLTTTIPIGLASNPSINTALFPLYDPTGSPTPVAPAPSPYGSVYITPIVGIDSVGTPVAGIEGDYKETNAAGEAVNITETTSYVVFNYDILSGSKIETLKYT